MMWSGKSLSQIYETVKSKPKLNDDTITLGLLGFAAAGIGNMLLTKNPDCLSTTIGAVQRAAMLNMDKVMLAFYDSIDSAEILYDCVVNSGAKDIIRDSGLLTGTGLLIGETIDKYTERTENKNSKGWYLIPILAGVLAVAYISNPSVLDFSNPDKTPVQDIPPEDNLIVNQTSDNVSTATPTEAPIAEPAGWWDADKYSGIEFGVVHSDANLFDRDIEGVIDVAARDSHGNYNVFSAELNDDGQPMKTFVHTEYGAGTFRSLPTDLAPGQYPDLVRVYGSPKEIIFEMIDMDEDGNFDMVALEYIGTKDTEEFKMPYGKPTTKTMVGTLSEMIVAKT